MVTCQETVHAKFWRMLGLEQSDWAGLKEHPVKEEYVLEDPITKEMTWYPPLSTERANHAQNKAFITDWMIAVYKEEEVSPALFTRTDYSPVAVSDRAQKQMLTHTGSII